MAMTLVWDIEVRASFRKDVKGDHWVHRGEPVVTCPPPVRPPHRRPYAEMLNHPSQATVVGE
jgi:hypothetical protein